MEIACSAAAQAARAFRRAAAAGVDRGLQRRRVEHRVVAGRQRVDQVVQHEADPFRVGPVQVRVLSQALGRLRGRQVGLHRAAQQRVAGPVPVSP